jgi:hypothetical protein
MFRSLVYIYGDGLLAPRPTPKLEDHTLSFVHCSLFNIFPVTFHTLRPSPHPLPEDAPSCGDRRSHLLWTSQTNKSRLYGEGRA